MHRWRISFTLLLVYGRHFPKLEPDPKPGFSKKSPGFGIPTRVSKPGFLLQTQVFGFGKSQTRVSGSGLEVTYLRSLQIGEGSAVDGWTGWANFSSSLSIIKLLQNCKYCRFDTLILIDLLMRQIVRLL